MKKMDQLREHSYDGIFEYDNPLPRWWVGLFYLTIIFAVIYMGWLHFMGGKTLSQELKEDIAAHEAQIQSGANSLAAGGGSAPGGGSPQGLQAKYSDQALVESGKEVYSTNCLPCHGDKGQGSIGPNLTDSAWLHGGSAEKITIAIADGVPDKGMPAWKAVLGPAKTEAVAAYVYTALRGTNVPGGKAPQGTPE